MFEDIFIPPHNGEPNQANLENENVNWDRDLWG